MCPFVSKSQARWMYANEPKMAAEWEDKTPSIKALPDKVGKKKKKKYMKKGWKPKKK